MTISSYFLIIRHLLKQYENPNIEDLKAFLKSYVRGKTNGIMTKCAIIKYCAWQSINREGLPKVQDLGRKHLESDIDVEKVVQILQHFPEGVYRDVFIVQMLSGCRSIEAWLIERANVRISPNSVDILIVQKGGRSRTIKLPLEPTRFIIARKEYEGKKYLFLRDEFQSMSRYDIIKKGYNGIKLAYWRKWQLACAEAGMSKYASHDIRRAVIRAIEAQYGLRMAQKAAGHRRIMTTLRYCYNEGLDVLGAINSIYGGS